MPDEKAKKAADEALQHLMQELAQGRSEGLKNYLSTMGRFHRYSWNNALLIHSQRPDATRVAGFHTWHDLGRSINKGEKGIMILAPVIVKEKQQQDHRSEARREPQRGNEASSQRRKEPRAEDAFRLAGFRTAYVFDVSQTQGKPLPEFAKTTGDPKDFGNKLKAVVAKHGIALSYDPSIAPAQGVSAGGKIRLVPGLSSAEEFSVLTHELAHEMLHHRKDVAQLPTVVRETQAEAVAHVVSHGVGLETNHAAADYIALYNGNKKTLAESLAVIQETSSKILDELLPEHQRGPVPHTNSWAAAVNRPQSHEPQPDLPNPSSPAPADAADSIVWDR